MTQFNTKINWFTRQIFGPSATLLGSPSEIGTANIVSPTIFTFIALTSVVYGVAYISFFDSVALGLVAAASVLLVSSFSDILILRWQLNRHAERVGLPTSVLTAFGTAATFFARFVPTVILLVPTAMAISALLLEPSLIPFRENYNREMNASAYEAVAQQLESETKKVEEIEAAVAVQRNLLRRLQEEKARSLNELHVHYENLTTVHRHAVIENTELAERYASLANAEEDGSAGFTLDGREIRLTGQIKCGAECERYKGLEKLARERLDKAASRVAIVQTEASVRESSLLENWTPRIELEQEHLANMILSATELKIFVESLHSNYEQSVRNRESYVDHYNGFVSKVRAALYSRDTLLGPIFLTIHTSFLVIEMFSLYAISLTLRGFPALSAAIAEQNVKLEASCLEGMVEPVQSIAKYENSIFEARSAKTRKTRALEKEIRFEKRQADLINQVNENKLRRAWWPKTQ